MYLQQQQQQQQQQNCSFNLQVNIILDDLDFADDLPLLSQTQQQMQEKTNSVAAASTT
ncbi:unnamed protein product, partial [Schistosoma curassoni]|uniref:Uncharacterized protein n=1 Tax=Schistosoma curassoni TaxID=6186 RepID=A0A183L681_9TREM